MTVIYNHFSPRLSDLDLEMARYIPPGGNWRDIPPHVPSKRLDQIRRSGGRTTYYGRLRWDRPSYTISTYFHRIGNGCNLHPEQDRVISLREAARLQSFKDDFVFYGPQTSLYKQIGNAVPPLLAYAVARSVAEAVDIDTMMDLFCGAGGMTVGFQEAGFRTVAANDVDAYAFETYVKNCGGKTREGLIIGDVTEWRVKERLVDAAYRNGPVGVLIGGPPCQGFSLAGWRDENDRRNDLVFHFMDMVRLTLPQAFVLENVPGILTMKKGAVIRRIGEAANAMGYSLRVLKLKAEQFGVPQLRRRVFIVGLSGSRILRDPEPLFDSGLPLLDHTAIPRPVTVREAIYGLPPLEPGGGCLGAMEADYEPSSPYQRYLAGQCTFWDFYFEQARPREPVRFGLSVRSSSARTTHDSQPQ